MTTTPINDTSITSGFNVDELTEGSLTGKGVLDVLLQTLRLHLDREFTSGRITGTAYATVYSQAITAFLAQAAQYAISKAKLPLELQLLQEQINLTQKQQDQITAAIRQTDYVTDYQLPSEVANKTKQTELLAYELTNIKPVELSIAQQDLALKTAQADLVEYDLTTLKPQELALLQQQVAVQLYTVQTRMPAEVANIQAETALKAYDLTDIKPTEKAQITQQTANLSSQQEQIIAETSRVLYQVNYQLPEEVTLIKLNQDQLIAQNNKIATDTVVTIKQGHLTDAQTCQVTAQTNQVNAEVALKLPKEVAQITAQTSLLAYDLTDIKPKEAANLAKTGLNIEAQTGQINAVVATKLPKEVLQIEAQTAQSTAQTSQITYTTSYVLPSQVTLTNAQRDSADAQTALYAQKTVTEQAQATDAPAATSVMGVQNALMEQQKNQIIRDAEQKTAKIMLDSWQTIFTTDQSIPPTGDISLLLTHVNAAKLKMLQGVGAV